jgi:hypothetical protein
MYPISLPLTKSGIECQKTFFIEDHGHNRHPLEYQLCFYSAFMGFTMAKPQLDQIMNIKVLARSSKQSFVDLIKYKFLVLQ